MTTVLAVYNSDGCVGRCDARCHGAKSKTCDCICGGRNHGKGLAQAIENNKEALGLTDEDLKRFAETHGRDPNDLKVIDRIETPSAAKARKAAHKALTQPDLFEGGKNDESSNPSQ